MKPKNIVMGVSSSSRSSFLRGRHNRRAQAVAPLQRGGTPWGLGRHARRQRVMCMAGRAPLHRCEGSATLIPTSSSQAAAALPSTHSPT